MPAKLSTICYVHNYTERLTSEYVVKTITGISRLDDDDSDKVIYLNIKAFIPVNKEIETHIENFESGQVIFLRGKFIACENWYSVRPSFSFFFINKDFFNLYY